MKTIRTLADLRPDPHNANRGSKRGLDLLERSLQRNGAGRSIVVDRHGVVIAGNKTLESAADLGLDVLVVKTNGRQLVVVQREDLDMASPKDARARELAIADNRTAQVSLDWDPEVLLHHVPGADLTGYFFDAELAALWGEANAKGELSPPELEPEPTAARTPAGGTESGGTESEGHPAHDAADEDQTICPECGHRF
jgi:hypothetical protein